MRFLISCNFTSLHVRSQIISSSSFLPPLLILPPNTKITIAHLKQYLIEVFYKLLELLGENIVQVQRQFDLPTMFLNLK